MHPSIGCTVYGREVDIYALGAVFYSLLTGNEPPAGNNAVEIMLEEEFKCEETRDLLKKLLDVESQYKINKIKQHPYFAVDFKTNVVEK